MQSSERQLQERLGAVLHRLSSLEQSLSSNEPRKPADKLVAEIRKMNAELERISVEVQETAASCIELRSSAQNAGRRADLLFVLSPIPTLLIERTGNVVDANPAAVRAVNTSHRYLVGKPLQLYIAADREAFVARLQPITADDATVCWPVTIRPRERSPMHVIFSAVVEAEDRLIVMLLSADQPYGDVVADLDDAVNAQPA